MSPNISSGSTKPLACLLLGNTCVNRAMERRLNPVMPAFDTPTMKAPRTAHIHCRGSAIMVDSLPRAAIVQMPNLYQDTAEPAVPTPALSGDVRTDVVVVGGGITGLSTALHLAEQGAQVVLLEAEEPGWGASGRNGGQVNPGLKHDPDEVERDYGRDLGARMNTLAGAAPKFVFDLIERHGIRCDARR